MAASQRSERRHGAADPDPRSALRTREARRLGRWQAALSSTDFGPGWIAGAQRRWRLLGASHSVDSLEVSGGTEVRWLYQGPARAEQCLRGGAVAGGAGRQRIGRLG
jgi:hypothetical protein